jgi:RNA polymerase sigma factor (sigma-70 family)
MTSVTHAGLPPFQNLLDAHGGAVLRMLTAMVGRQEADDAWQTTFTQAWSAYPSLTSADNLTGWLFTIARRVAIDTHRAAGRRTAHTVIDAPDDVLALPLVVEPHGGDPAEAVFDAALWQQVDRLPPKQRAAIVYRYVGDLPYDAIAVLMECSAAAARRSAHEGVRRLRQEVAR